MKGTQCPATDPASIQAHHELHAHHDELHCAIDLMPRLFIWRGSCALHSGEDAFLRFQRDDPSQNVNGCVRDDSSRSAEDEREFDEMWREFVRSEPVQEVDDPFMLVWMVDVDGAVQKKLEQFSEDEFQEAKQLGIAPTVPVKEKEKGGSVCPSFLKVDKVAQGRCTADGVCCKPLVLLLIVSLTLSRDVQGIPFQQVRVQVAQFFRASTSTAVRC